MVAEFLLVDVEQAVPVLVLLDRHGREYFCRGREILAQPLGDVVIDAAILFFGADRQRQDLTFGKL